MRLPFVATFLVLGLCLSVSARAKELPLWEVGLGLGTLSIPDYRGADARGSYVIPLPYVVYRGDKLEVDRDGLRSDLFKSPRLKLDLSLSAGAPAKGGESSARAGMPDIDPTFEAGPSLKIELAANAKRDRLWSLGLPLRAVIATDFSHVDAIGWVFSPYIAFNAGDVGPGGGWWLTTSLGPLYASEKYHDYYYEVAPAFATATRSTYDADGGYSGTRLTVTMSKRFPNFWVGVFARYDRLDSASFSDSPLVQRDDAFMIGGGIAWIVGRSEKTVPRRDELESSR